MFCCIKMYRGQGNVGGQEVGGATKIFEINLLRTWCVYFVEISRKNAA